MVVLRRLLTGLLAVALTQFCVMAVAPAHTHEGGSGHGIREVVLFHGHADVELPGGEHHHDIDDHHDDDGHETDADIVLNLGGSARARAERDRARHQREAFGRTIARQRAALVNQIETARIEVEGLDARVIPSSEEALRFARDGYARGAFSYIDVLEAQRALSEARLRRIASLRSYHRALASLERLAGDHAVEISQ